MWQFWIFKQRSYSSQTEGKRSYLDPKSAFLNFCVTQFIRFFEIVPDDKN